MVALITVLPFLALAFSVTARPRVVGGAPTSSLNSNAGLLAIKARQAKKKDVVRRMQGPKRRAGASLAPYACEDALSNGYFQASTAQAGGAPSCWFTFSTTEFGNTMLSEGDYAYQNEWDSGEHFAFIAYAVDGPSIMTLKQTVVTDDSRALYQSWFKLGVVQNGGPACVVSVTAEGDRSSDYNPFTSPDLCGPDSGDECSPSGAAVWRTTTVGFGQPDVAAVVLTFTIDCSTTKDGQTSQLYLVDEVSLGAQH